MTREGRGVVVICSHGVGDPLVAPLMLDYVYRLQEEDEHRQVLLFTEERELPEADVKLLDRLRSLRISWVPLRYDLTRAQWPQKLRIGAQILWRANRFLRRFEHPHLIGYLSLAGSYAVLLQTLGFGRCITVCFEPHSLYMLEMGVWGRRSLKFRLVNYLERFQMRRSNVLIVPTTAVRDHALQNGRKGVTLLQGITIDVAAAAFNPTKRAEVRGRFGLRGKTVLGYVGKFGGIYHGLHDYVRFMQRVADEDADIRFLIITQQEWVDALEHAPGIGDLRERIIAMPPVPPAELPGWLSAADLGVIAVPPTPSQAFRTPVKTAYYWAAGLPIVIPRGVSDDHFIAQREDVGIVVDDLPDLDPPSFVAACARYRAQPPGELRARCLRVAMEHRDTSRMVSLLKEALV